MSVKLNDLGYIQIELNNSFEQSEENPKKATPYEKLENVDDYVAMMHSITHYLNHINKDFENDVHKYSLINLLNNMLPTNEQAKQMFNINTK